MRNLTTLPHIARTLYFRLFGKSGSLLTSIIFIGAIFVFILLVSTEVVCFLSILLYLKLEYHRSSCYWLKNRGVFLSYFFNHLSLAVTKITGLKITIVLNID